MTSTAQGAVLELSHAADALSLEAASESLLRTGYYVIGSAFSETLLSALHDLAQSQRVEWSTPEVAGPLAQGEFLEGAQTHPLLSRVLGEGYIMGRLFITRGARDVPPAICKQANLFGDARADGLVPTVGVAMFLALEPCTLRVVPRSASDTASPAMLISLARGACLLFDVRLEVSAPEAHTALVAVYYRSWYREPRAQPSEPPIVITQDVYECLSESQRTLFAWRFDRYAARRPKLFVQRVISHLPAPIVGRIRRLVER